MFRLLLLYRLRPSPGCSPHVPVVVNESDPTTCCCCFTNTNYTTCPNPSVRTLSRVHVWEQEKPCRCLRTSSHDWLDRTASTASGRSIRTREKRSVSGITRSLTPLSATRVSLLSKTGFACGASNNPVSHRAAPSRSTFLSHLLPGVASTTLLELSSLLAVIAPLYPSSSNSHHMLKITPCWWENYNAVVGKGVIPSSVICSVRPVHRHMGIDVSSGNRPR